SFVAARLGQKAADLIADRRQAADGEVLGRDTLGLGLVRLEELDRLLAIGLGAGGGAFAVLQIGDLAVTLLLVARLSLALARLGRGGIALGYGRASRHGRESMMT